MEIAQSILTTLRRERMPPTYGFIIGKRVEEDASTIDVLKAWRAEGQPLGNHTWAHADFNPERPAQFAAEAVKDEALLQRLMGDGSAGSAPTHLRQEGGLWVAELAVTLSS